MKRTKVIALLLGGLGIGLAPVASFAFTTPTPTKAVANVSDWYSWFYWTLKNDTPQTITNVYVAHQTKNGADNNEHTIASIAPGQTVGPFWGDWHSTYEDDWVLRYKNPLKPLPSGYSYNVGLFGTGLFSQPWKKCSVSSSDLNNGTIQMNITSNPPDDDDFGNVSINMPVSSSCNGLLEIPQRWHS